MREQKISFQSLLLYVVTAILAMATASWLASQFVGRAFSQTTPVAGTTSPDNAPGQNNIQPPMGAMPPQNTGAPANFPSNQPMPIQNVPMPPPIVAPSPIIVLPPTNDQNSVPTPPKVQKSQIETYSVQAPNEVTSNSEVEQKIPEQLAGIIEDYSYTPMGKRDPFLPFEHPSNTSPQGPIWPLQKFELDQLKLVGVIWDVKTPKAMILDPSGHGYVVTVNERIGRNNGYIARIREGEIVVIENVTTTEGKTTYITKLMKLQPQ